MALSGKISRGLGRSQQGGQTAQQRFHFLNIQDCRFNLQSRRAQRNKRWIGLNRLLKLGGSSQIAPDGFVRFDLMRLAFKREIHTLGPIWGRPIWGRPVCGGIHGHADSLLLHKTRSKHVCRLFGENITLTKMGRQRQTE